MKLFVESKNLLQVIGTLDCLRHFTDENATKVLDGVIDYLIQITTEEE